MSEMENAQSAVVENQEDEFPNLDLAQAYVEDAQAAHDSNDVIAEMNIQEQVANDPRMFELCEKQTPFLQQQGYDLRRLFPLQYQKNHPIVRETFSAN